MPLAARVLLQQHSLWWECHPILRQDRYHQLWRSLRAAQEPCRWMACSSSSPSVSRMVSLRRDLELRFPICKFANDRRGTVRTRNAHAASPDCKLITEKLAACKDLWTARFLPRPLCPLRDVPCTGTASSTVHVTFVRFREWSLSHHMAQCNALSAYYAVV